MKPRKFKSESLKEVVSVEMRQDKKGDLFYMVSFPECSCSYICFSDLSSVLDFIKSNF